MSDSAKLAGLNTKIETSRKALNTLWSTKKENAAPLQLCKDKWNGWSVSVRTDYLKRAQAAIIAGIQTSVPRKQWSQWEVTLKFCLDDIFTRARTTVNHKFEDKEHGLLVLIETINKGEENDLNPEAFDKKIGEMLDEMKTNQVPGFDPEDMSHGPTLRAIRSIYAIEWAAYLVTKMMVNN